MNRGESFVRGQAMWIILNTFFFYTIKYVKFDKGGGNSYPQKIWRQVMFPFIPSPIFVGNLGVFTLITQLQGNAIAQKCCTSYAI